MSVFVMRFGLRCFANVLCMMLRIFRLLRMIRLNEAAAPSVFHASNRRINVSTHDLEALESREDLEMAKTAQRCLVKALDHSNAVSIALLEEGVERIEGAPTLKLPPRVLRLFADMLGDLAQGKAVALMPKDIDVTTQQAAQMLNISRPYLIRLLEEKKIPFHMVGSHRRIHLSNVLDYKERRSQTSKAALRALIEEGQELDEDDQL